jgi:rhamnose transport system permease protein
MVNALASPYFLNIWNLSDATFNFTEKAIIVLPMAMLIIARKLTCRWPPRWRSAQR